MQVELKPPAPRVFSKQFQTLNYVFFFGQGVESEAVHHFDSTMAQNSGNIKHLHTYIKKVDGGREGSNEKKK